MHLVRSADVVDRRRGQIGFDQLDPSSVDHLVVDVRGHGHGPAEVVGDPESHGVESARRRPRRHG